MTKKLIMLSLLSLIFLSCESDNCDKYYDAAWDGEKEPSSWASQKQKEAYQQGLDDANMYDDGFFDGRNGNKPIYTKDSYYMDGYKDGKKAKKHPCY